jgi:two-component system response regulator NreC
MGGHVWFRGDDEEPTDAERKFPLVEDPLERVRVLIVTSDPASRTGLRAVLGLHEDVRVVAEAADAGEAISEVRAKAPDVVVLDGVPAPGAVEAVRRVLAEFPDGKTLVLSARDDPSCVREAFRAGASGYLLEGAAEAELLAAVRAVAAGQLYVDPVLGARVIAGEVRGREDVFDDPLTSRQREVVRLLALGHTNQEIAEKLVLSVRTVETHRAHVMQKLQISTRAELVRFAMDRGLLTD